MDLGAEHRTAAREIGEEATQRSRSKLRKARASSGCRGAEWRGPSGRESFAECKELATHWMLMAMDEAVSMTPSVQFR